MANYCNNTVQFSGPANKLSEMRACFAEIAKQDYGLPPFIQSDVGHFIRLSLRDDRLSYITRYSPNLNIVLAVADHFGLDYQHDYVETGLALYGQTRKTGDQTEHFRLNYADLRLIEFDVASEQAFYKGEFYDSEWDVWPVMLQNKKDAYYTEAVQNRLGGALPHILLGPDDYLIDWKNRQFVKAGEPAHTVDMKSMLLNPDESGYIMYYYLPAQQAVPPPKELQDCPDNVWVLEIPREWDLDPIAYALEKGNLASDHLLTSPYQTYRCANTFSAAEYLARQTNHGRSR